MTTILVWLGSGFAFAVGVGFGAWLMRSTWKRPKDVLEVEKKATEALLERNEIGRDQVEALDRIASALEANLQEMRDEDDDCDD
jgi:hypothetical protein